MVLRGSRHILCCHCPCLVQPVSHGNSSSVQPLSPHASLPTSFPASGCVTGCALSASRNSSSSSSSASGANRVWACSTFKGFGAEVSTLNSSQVSGPFFTSVTRGMMSLFPAEEPSVTSFCFGKFCLLHRLRQNWSRVRIIKQKAQWKRSRANWTLVFLDSPSKFPFLSSLLKELSSKAIKRLSTWGGVGMGAQGEWKI